MEFILDLLGIFTHVKRKSYSPTIAMEKLNVKDIKPLIQLIEDGLTKDKLLVINNLFNNYKVTCDGYINIDGIIKFKVLILDTYIDIPINLYSLLIINNSEDLYLNKLILTSVSRYVLIDKLYNYIKGHSKYWLLHYVGDKLILDIPSKYIHRKLFFTIDTVFHDNKGVIKNLTSVYTELKDNITDVATHTGGDGIISLKIHVFNEAGECLIDGLHERYCKK